MTKHTSLRGLYTFIHSVHVLLLEEAHLAAGESATARECGL